LVLHFSSWGWSSIPDFPLTPWKEKRYPIIDTHIHIDELVDLEGLVRWAQSAGIKALIGVGSDFISNDKVLKIGQTF